MELIMVEFMQDINYDTREWISHMTMLDDPADGIIMGGQGAPILWSRV